MYDLLGTLAPAPRTRHLDWCRENMQNENGRPFDHDAYPHLGAPGGPCDAMDDQAVRLIVLQFASRLGKTFFGQCMHLFVAAVMSAPMMFVSSVEKVACEVVARTYALIAKCPPLAARLLREDRRKHDCIDLQTCKCFVGWARSVSTLADKNVKFGHANELDKWERLSTSTEGDPLDLFLDRAKDFPTYKYLLESTPSVRGGSRIERARLQGSNSAFYVPCPHCQHYQTLKLVRIIWEKPKHGPQDPDLAKRTARYMCEHCNGACLDHHRSYMMRLGVWVPDGCDIDHGRAMKVAMERRRQLAAGTFSHELPGRFWKQDYLIGEPVRDGSSASYQLSSLYALARTWGDIAEKWVSVQGNKTSEWNFVNQWLGETWVVNTRCEDWEAIYRKIVIDIDRYVAPIWASLVTVGVDRQKDHYVYVVDAFGPDNNSHTMDYGKFNDLTWLLNNVILREYDHADGGKIRVSRTLVDSGFNPKEPYEFSRFCLSRSPRLMVLCCKGSSTPLYTPFKISTLGPETSMPGLPLVRIDGDWTQGELEAQLHETKPGAPGSISLFYGEKEEHEDYIKQLLNEIATVKVDNKNHTQTVWNQADENYPNDIRDAKRYARGGCLIYTSGGPPRARSAPAPKPAPPLLPDLSRMPDGRPFLVSQR